jgi:hypothetical protein
LEDGSLALRSGWGLRGGYAESPDESPHEEFGEQSGVGYGGVG